MLARFMAATLSIARGSTSSCSVVATHPSEPQDDICDCDNNSNNSVHSSNFAISHNHDDSKSGSDNNASADEDNNNNNSSNNSTRSRERETHRVRAVGWDNRMNEVLVAPSTQREAKSTVLFFPGDVMDFCADMASGAYHEFSDFAYERVARALGDKFGDDCNVWIVRPARLHQRAFSCFDHFVASNEFGAAMSYSSGGSAIKHLLTLLENVRDVLLSQGVTVVTDLPVHLVGFSKGVVVLNQLVTELAICKREGFKSNNRHETLLADISRHHKFFSTVQSIHWVDGGNGSRRGVIPSDERALAAIHDFSNARLFVHVTPYQFESKERPWIKQEIQEFVQHMRRVHADVQLKMYYNGKEGSIHSHFQLLLDFEVQRASSSSKMSAFSSPEHSLPRVAIQSM